MFTSSLEATVAAAGGAAPTATETVVRVRDLHKRYGEHEAVRGIDLELRRGEIFACIGYAVSGLIGSQDAAQPTVQMTMLPLWFISGVFIPVASLSTGLKDLADVFPVRHLANSLDLASVHSSFGGSISGTDMIVLAAWAVGAAAFCAWRFSWLPAGARA